MICKTVHSQYPLIHFAFCENIKNPQLSVQAERLSFTVLEGRRRGPQ
jgi:hypothetical protein